MKKILTIFSFLVISVSIIAQGAKTDVIQKQNGEELKGKITEVSDSEIKFIYAGETAVYVIKKSDIQKVTYASGRVETFSTPPATPANPVQTTPATPATTNSGTTADVRNKVAIIPFTFLKQNEDAGDAMSYKVQQDTYEYLSKHSGMYTYLDPRTTNALLLKGGVNKSTLMSYTMEDLCKIIGVEYIVTGTVTQIKASSTSSSYNNTDIKTNTKNTNNANVSNSSSSTSQDNYAMTVTVEVYNNNNNKVYGDTHHRFLNSTTAEYSDPLQYLLKRTPLYQK